MNSQFKHHNVHPKARKRLKRCTKSVWNDLLKELWYVLCEIEKQFLQSTGYNRNKYRQEFREAQNKFDKLYRKTERKYNNDKIIEIETVSAADPNQFWKQINKLGPYNKNYILMEVYNDAGEIDYDISKVMEKWRSEYEKLYIFMPTPDTYNDQIYNDCINRLGNLEQPVLVLDN